MSAFEIQQGRTTDMNCFFFCFFFVCVCLINPDFSHYFKLIWVFIDFDLRPWKQPYTNCGNSQYKSSLVVFVIWLWQRNQKLQWTNQRKPTLLFFKSGSHKILTCTGPENSLFLLQTNKTIYRLFFFFFYKVLYRFSV